MVELNEEQRHNAAECMVSDEVSAEEIIIPVNTHRVASSRNHHEPEGVELKRIDQMASLQLV